MTPWRVSSDMNPTNDQRQLTSELCAHIPQSGLSAEKVELSLIETAIQEDPALAVVGDQHEAALPRLNDPCDVVPFQELTPKQAKAMNAFAVDFDCQWEVEGHHVAEQRRQHGEGCRQQ
jgi:hypothetical protein